MFISMGWGRVGVQTPEVMYDINFNTDTLYICIPIGFIKWHQ